jgi:hypothetical protein
MEATSAAVAAASQSKRVAFGSAQVGAVAIGGIVAIVGVFLKGFKIPPGVIYTGSTNFINSSGGKIVLGAAIVGLVFLAIAAATHRKGVLWGTYVCSVVVLLIAGIDAGSGFTLTLVAGGSVKADAAIGVFVSLVGGVIMLVGAIAVRQSAKPAE